MVNSTTPSWVTIILCYIVAIILVSPNDIEAEIGVSYGNSGSNLPSPQEVVNIYKNNNIKAMRLYYPDPSTLQALQNQGITLMLDVQNDIIQRIAYSHDEANQWVTNNVVPYKSFIKYIVVGNEINPQSIIPPAMQNILNALNTNMISGIYISTSISYGSIIKSYPPSDGEFKDPSSMALIINFLRSHRSPLLVNFYPYIAHRDNPNDVPLDYALFKWNGTKFTDPKNQLGYQNLFDAMVDSVYAAIGKIGGNSVMKNGMDVKVAASESGWPSGGSLHPNIDNEGALDANPDNAGTYYRNLINHVSQGTPLTPNEPIATYLFSMFDEADKPKDDTEHYFGLFKPDGQPKYGHINF